MFVVLRSLLTKDLVADLDMPLASLSALSLFSELFLNIRWLFLSVVGLLADYGALYPLTLLSLLSFLY